jgi:hypothetical protein
MCAFAFYYQYPAIVEHYYKIGVERVYVDALPLPGIEGQ